MARIFTVPIFGTSKPEKTSVFFLCHFFWDVKTAAGWDGQGVELKAKYVFEREQMGFLTSESGFDHPWAYAGRGTAIPCEFGLLSRMAIDEKAEIGFPRGAARRCGQASPQEQG